MYNSIGQQNTIYNIQSVNYNIQFQQFELAQSISNMDPVDETKSTDKYSSHSSQGKPRRRPSLFPIRNSAKRKSSFSESPHIFDPHRLEQGQSKCNEIEFDTDISGERETKSETQFQFKTPHSQLSHSSPRTPRTTPRQLAVDTPFVPFVHQSLTRTVWQSQQIIPEERDEMQRKESQTQYHFNKQEKQQNKDSPICATANQIKYKNQQNVYPDLSINATSQIIKTQQNTNNHHNHTQLSNFQLQTSQQVFISIPPSQKQYNKQQQHQILNTIQPQHNNNNNNSNTQFQTITNIKNEQQSQHVLNINNINNINSNNNNINTNTNIQVINQVRHDIYATKAHIYYKQQLQNIQRNKQFIICNSFHQHVLPHKVYRKLGFSFIDSISVRPKIILIQAKQQQTQSKQLNISQPCFQYTVKPINKQCEFCQTQQQNNLSVGNKFHQGVSTKKNTKQSQTSFNQRFQLISKNYQQKIEMQKQYVESEQQTYISKFNCAQQTQSPQNKLRINNQVDFSVSYDYQHHLDASVVRFQNYLKNLHETRESQLLQAKKRKFINQQTSTDNIHQNTNTSNKKKSNTKIKSVKNFACQYDQKDIGIKPSIKRVSIAQKNVVFDIPDDDNSTQTFQLSEEKKIQSKKKKKDRKSKKILQKQVKIEQRSVESQQSQLYVPSQQVEAQAGAEAQRIETRKSKRKASKTPMKKKN